MAQRAQIASQHRIISSIGFTAQERYLDFIKRYPKIYPRISNMQLASYLGVTQEFLSRLKRQILKPNRPTSIFSLSVYSTFAEACSNKQFELLKVR